MDEVTVRELRNHGGDVIDRVEQGETLLVTRAGVPVGVLGPIPRPRLSATSLLARWRNVPRIDADAFRSDIDAVIDPTL
ncbi:type II toxin-antitoxin system Phd/YefM family antitoxin [Pseudonocardia sp. TRM90224]|uniref:type II toxin-antitoxin system Phd/YefM family antitoxin n=1 Tax=Pseudonocardia sp. TRM90224 TaxID=2812678 RepID=UPI001E55B026|nr:type II toxin-antitoxin system prevent-host-death family antitoxin [Pseudonocardia sp. TRM90224]